MRFSFGAALALLALAPLGAPGCADFERGPPSGADGAPVNDAGAMGPGGAPAFGGDVQALLIADCQSCHSPNGNAASTGWVLSGDGPTDLKATLPFVDTSAPASSRLLTKAAGTGHGGGRLYPTDSTEYTRILEWISDGAPP